MSQVDLRQLAAEHALQFVKSGMVLGLGTGATAAYFAGFLAEMLHSGKLRDIQVVPTSERTAENARDLNIPITNLREYPRLHLAVDGADEVDPSLNLIKGLGRALLREKIIAVHSDQFVIICDESKLVERLGQQKALPVEILPFEAEAHVRWLGTLGCKAELWLETDGTPAVTDNGNYLARCWFKGGIPNSHALALQLANRPGILEHGLFLNMADKVIVAGRGGVSTMQALKEHER